MICFSNVILRSEDGQLTVRGLAVFFFFFLAMGILRLHLLFYFVNYVLLVTLSLIVYFLTEKNDILLKVLFFKIDLVPVNKQSSRKFEKKSFGSDLVLNLLLLLLFSPKT